MFLHSHQQRRRRRRLAVLPSTLWLQQRVFARQAALPTQRARSRAIDAAAGAAWRWPLERLLVGVCLGAAARPRLRRPRGARPASAARSSRCRRCRLARRFDERDEFRRRLLLPEVESARASHVRLHHRGWARSCLSHRRSCKQTDTRVWCRINTYR